MQVLYGLQASAKPVVVTIVDRPYRAGRHILNVQDLQVCVMAKWTDAVVQVVHIEGLDLKQQIALFQHTSILIWTHGAAMADLLFLPQVPLPTSSSSLLASPFTVHSMMALNLPDHVQQCCCQTGFSSCLCHCPYCWLVLPTGQGTSLHLPPQCCHLKKCATALSLLFVWSDMCVSCMWVVVTQSIVMLRTHCLATKSSRVSMLWVNPSQHSCACFLHELSLSVLFTCNVCECVHASRLGFSMMCAQGAGAIELIPWPHADQAHEWSQSIQSDFSLHIQGLDAP